MSARGEMRPTDEELGQLRAWHAEYEARDDLDACLRGYGALVAKLEGQLDRLSRALEAAGVPSWVVEAIKRG